MSRFRPLQIVIVFALIVSSVSTITPNTVFSKLSNTSPPIRNTVLSLSPTQDMVADDNTPNFALASGVTAIAAGGRVSCALTSGRRQVLGWELRLPVLGDGTTTDRLVPVDVSGLTSGVTADCGGWRTPVR